MVLRISDGACAILSDTGKEMVPPEEIMVTVVRYSPVPELRIGDESYVDEGPAARAPGTARV